MEIRIGIINSPTELTFDSSQDAAAVKAAVKAAAADNSPLELADSKGNEYIVPAAALAYVAVSSGETRKVGFVS